MFEELIELYKSYILSTDEKILKNINRYFDIKTKISKEDLISSIIDNEKYFELLITENYNINFFKKSVTGEYFPYEYNVNRYECHDVDYVNYRIGISNGEKVFHYTKNLLPSNVDTVEIRGDYLMISLCSYRGNLIGDDEKLSELKQKSIKYIEEIRSKFLEINKMHKEYCDNLLSKVQSLYDNKLREEKKKEEAINKLNPFK